MRISLTDIPTDALNAALEYSFTHGYSVRIKNTCAIRRGGDGCVLVFDVTIDGNCAREVFRTAWMLHSAASDAVALSLPASVCLSTEDGCDQVQLEHAPPCCSGGIER